MPCYVDLIRPEVGVSVVRVLRGLGVDVAYPEGQTCCGQPAFNGGDYAYQMANAVIYFLITLIISLMQLRIIQRRGVAL